MNQKVVAYYRVSTEKQGRSGLGLEGQQAAVQQYVKGTGVRILAGYIEVESGKRADRPQLAKALAHARRAKAVLVVAKLDRLARNVAFLSALMEAGVEFLACDNPTANRLTIHILAAVAEDEARRISDRTKAALAAFKARGGQLGASRPESRNLSAEARQNGALAGAAAVTALADRAYEDLRPILVRLRQAGTSLTGIAELLNAAGHLTRRGGQWNHVTVGRACERLGL